MSKKLLIILFLVLIIVFGCAFVLDYFNKNIDSEKQAKLNKTDEILEIKINHDDFVATKIYENVKLENILLPVPDGYTLERSNQVSPLFLILSKDKNIYAYNTKTGLISLMALEKAGDLELREDKRLLIFPSITEKDKFMIIIQTLDLNNFSEFFGTYMAKSHKMYFFDASKNKLTEINNKDFDGCVVYDSKYSRFFTWPCGEGIGSRLPLLSVDVSGFPIKEMLSIEYFNTDDIYSVDFKPQDDLFFAISGDKDFNDGKDLEVVVINPNAAEPIKDVYVMNAENKARLGRTFSFGGFLRVYSMAIDKDNNTIIIGGDNYILLLKYNADNKIIKSEYIPEENVYANDILVNNGRLYYQGPDYVIRDVNLADWKVERLIQVQKTVLMRELYF